MGGGTIGTIKHSLGAKTKKKYSASVKQHIQIKDSVIDNNIKEASELFEYKDGMFGKENRKSTRTPREIFVKNPLTSSAIFFNILKKGSTTRILKTSYGSGMDSIFEDGTRIIYRKVTSSQGSPAVEVVVSNSSKLLPKKYHFVKEVKK